MMWNYCIKNGMLNPQQIQAEIEMTKKKELLAMHPYSIFQDKNGKWCTYLPDNEKGRLYRKRNTKEEIETVVITYWEQTIENPTIQEVFNEWNDRKLMLCKISKPTHLRNIQIFNKHYSEIKDKRIKSVTPEFLSDYLEEQIPKHNLTAKAFSNLRTITRGFFKRAKKRKLVDFHIEDVFTEMDLSDREYKKIFKEDCQEVFDEEETEKIMVYLHQNLDLRNLGILLMFVTGIRVGELVGLKHEDCEDNIIKIRRTATRYYDDEMKKYQYDIKDSPKTQAGIRSVIVPLDYTWLMQKIKLLNPFGDYIFIENGKHLTTNVFRTRLRTICKKLNIVHKSPHKIRKTYGTILLDNNIDEKFITGQMGHTNILCTEQHYHRNRKNLTKKIEILSSIPDFRAK